MVTENCFTVCEKSGIFFFFALVGGNPGYMYMYTVSMTVNIIFIVFQHVLEFCVQRSFTAWKTGLYLASPIGSLSMLSTIDKTMVGLPISSISITCICSFLMPLSGKTMRTMTFAPFRISFLFCRVDINIRLFPKRMLAKLYITKSFEERRWTTASFCSSLSKETWLWKIFLNTILTMAPLQITALYVSKMTTAAKYKIHPAGFYHDPMLSRWWHFFHLQTDRNFQFPENWGIRFGPKMSTTPLFFSLPCQVSCFALVSSSLATLSACQQWQNIWEACEQCTLDWK